MKKTIFVTILILVFMFTSFSILNSSSTEDYKAIKKAVKKKNTKRQGELTWFKLTVTDNFSKKIKVRIKLPIAIVDWLSECTDGSFRIRNKCTINLKRILKDLKKSKKFTILEMEDEDDIVKIWVE